MSTLQPHPYTEPSPFYRRWPLLGLAALSIVLLAAAAVIWLVGTTPAGAQDGYEPDQNLIDDVRGYAQETEKGHDHVLRWMRVLHTFDALDDVTAAEAQDYADNGWQRWDPVADALAQLENAPGDYQPDGQLISDVRGYSQETESGYDHVLRWMRVLHTFDALDDVTAAEAQDYADNGWQRWEPVAAELAELEAAAATIPAVAAVAVASDPGDDNTYAPNDLIRIRLTYSETVEVSGTPRLQIDLDPAHGGEVWANYESGSGTASLSFTHTVAEPDTSTQGVAVLRDTLELNGGAIRSAAAQTDAALSHQGLEHDGAHQVDTAAPALAAAAVDGATLTASFSEPLDEGLAVAGRAFTVTARLGAAPERTIAGTGAATVAGAVVTVTLAGAVQRGDTLTVAYAPSGDGPVRDLAGNAATAFSGETVTNETTDPNLAPVVNTQAANYAGFVGRNNAPRGLLVSKPFHGIFSDPDGDKLTYSVSVPADQLRLVDEVLIPTEEQMEQSGHPIEVIQRVFFRGEAEADWKAITPPVPDRPVVTATLTATDPGGRSASVQGDFLVWWDSYPEVVIAVASASVIELTFDWAVEGDPAPKAGQFTVHVVEGNGSSRTVTVSSVSVSGKVMRLELASALAAGQSVTLDYAYDYPDDVPLQRAGGGDAAPGFTGQAVTVSLPLSEPQNFAVTAKQGELNLWARWDAAQGATSYKLRWRQSGGEFETANAVTVTDTETTITVSGYGEWEVQLQACNDAGCAPEDGQPADEAPVVRLTLEQSRKAQGQSRARSLTETSSPAEDETSYTLGWRRDGTDAQGPAQPPANPPGDGFRAASDQADTTPPVLWWGTIDGDTTTLYFSEPLDASYTGGHLRMTVSFLNSWTNFTVTPSSVTIDGNKVTYVGVLNWGPRIDRVTAGHGVQVYYYTHDTNARDDRWLRDLAGNVVSTPLRSLGGHFPATRTIWLSNLTASPSLESATAYLNWLTLTFDERLHGNSVPAADAFTVRVNGSPVSLASANPVAISGNIVTLLLASALSSTDVVTVSYTKPSVSPLRGPYGEAQSFSNRSVTNRVGTVPTVSQVAVTSNAGTDQTYAPGDTIRVSLTFGEAVNVDTTSGTPRLKLDLYSGDGGERWADYTSGSGTKTLEFAYTVVADDLSTAGIAVLRDALDLNGGAIRSAAAQKAAHLWHGGLDHDPDHKVDGAAPSLRSAAMTEETKLTLTFNESLDEDSVPPASAFTVKAGGSEVNLASASPVEVAGEVVALTLAEAVVEGSAVTVSYTKPASSADNKLKDAAGNEVASFSDQVVIPDGMTTSLWIATVKGTELTMRYYRLLDEDSVPPPSAFTVKKTPSGGSEVTVSLAESPVISGRAVRLTLSSAVAEGDTVTVSYTKPTSGVNNKLTDAAGDEVASFTNWTVSYDNTRPRLVRGEIDGDILTQFYSEPLDEDLVPPASFFKVNLAFTEGIFTADEAAIIGNKVVLTLAHRAKVGQIVNTRYEYRVDASGHRLRDLAGNEVSTPSMSRDIHDRQYKGTRIITPNNLTLPSLESATVNRDGLTLTFDTAYMSWQDGMSWQDHFDSPLEGDPAPAASAFTVKVNGSVVSLASANPVAVAGSDVTLTLASTVSAGDTVTVSYAKPAANPLRNAVAEVASFADEPVTNVTTP